MLNSVVKRYLTTRIKQIERFVTDPHGTQQKVLQQVLDSTVNHGLKEAKYTAFKKTVPLSSYESLAPHIHDMMVGKQNTLTKKKIKWFSKSSGTSEGKSKFIPLSKSFLINNHIRASWFAAALVYDQNPKATIFKNKNLLMGGSIEHFPMNPKVQTGDISGFTISNIPAIGRPFYTPDFKTALIKDWDLKIQEMVKICSKESVFLIAGVPTWSLVLFEKMLEHTGKQNMLEVWDEAHVYLHGGINFSPYKKQFQQLFPSDDFRYMEIYNASEGAFAIQNDYHEDGMLLLLDTEIFYEFIPIEELDKAQPAVLPLAEVEIHKNYALVISTTAGLLRYIVGDVVKFVSTNPYKIKVVGRTREYINAFGEELVIENVESALSKVCMDMNLDINNYTVCPIYIEKGKKGKHQWLIEFIYPPQNKAAFEKALDLALQALNSDYEAKRQHDLAIERLEVVTLPKGTFESWLRSKGKFGNQFKVPRLKNDRSIAEELLKLIQ